MRPYLVSQSHYLASRNLLTTTRKTRSNRILGGWGMSAESLFPDIPKRWTVTTLGELAKASGGDIQSGPFGSQLHASDYVDDGIPSIMPKNITVDAITTDDIARVSPDDVERLSKYKVQVGDIIYSRRGDVEKCARITETEDGWLCGTGCLRVRIKPTIISTEFLHAYLCHPVVREWIVRHAVGATMPNLNTSILSALPVGIPNKSEMTAIGSIWLTISDQIRLNSQINQTLEQMAQAIFKSWFVDFEPVKAKIAALEAGGSEEDALLAAMQAISAKDEIELARLQAEQPGQYAELRATAELFPSAMQESELGEIPEGWAIAPFSSIARLDTTSVKPAQDPEKIWEHYSIPAFDEGATPVFETGVDIKSNKYKVYPTAVLSSKLNPHFPRTWIPNVQSPDAAICSTEFMQFVPIEPQHRAFIAGMITSEPFQSGIMMRVTGSTGSRQRAQPKQVAAMDVILPKSELRAVYSQHTEAMYRMQSKNIWQARSLASLRDTLLPKLLSGELSTPNAMVEATA